MINEIRIGVAGWSLPTVHRRADSRGKTLLQQYAELFSAVEINSSFYRPHRFTTYERWGASVPDQFRFAVKVPKLMTHELRLVDCHGEIESFSAAVRGLRNKLAVLLVQLPPSLSFDEAAARDFFHAFSMQFKAQIVCEPRSPDWFTAAADDIFAEFHVTRVTADPRPEGCHIEGSQYASFDYLRLHGAPQIYHSSYTAAHLSHLAAAISARRGQRETWCIFDNTASGAAWPNALALASLLNDARCGLPPQRSQTY